MTVVRFVLASAIAGIAILAFAKVIARTTVAGESFASAFAQFLSGLSGVGTAILLGPFLIVGVISGMTAREDSVRWGWGILAASCAVLALAYIDGHYDAQTALAQERWTASALSVGLLPFTVGVPVVLAAAFAALLASKPWRRNRD